jgi:hypothetical protein
LARSSRKRRKQRQRKAAAGRARSPEAANGDESEADAMARSYARSRAKDEAARAALEPLAEGERPRAVTVAAAVALLLGVSNIVVYAAGVEVQGDRPAVSGLVVFSLLMLVAAWGCWRARYWAVLGMQALLALGVIIFSLLLVRASSILAVVVALVVIGGGGTLFWFLVKALARIQMPERPGA